MLSNKYNLIFPNKFSFLLNDTNFSAELLLSEKHMEIILVAFSIKTIRILQPTLYVEQ